jgi:hypothetical protein
MLYGAKVAIYSEICTKHINTMWAECKILETEACYCITYSAGFKRLSRYINSYNNRQGCTVSRESHVCDLRVSPVCRMSWGYTAITIN